MTASPTLADGIASEIRAEMARQRISGAAIAQKLGVSDMYLSRRLTGEVAFDVTDLERVAGALGVSVMQLIPTQVRAA